MCASAGSFARLVSSNVRARAAYSLVLDIYMRSRRGGSGTPVDFLPREKDGLERDEEGGEGSSSRRFFLFVLERKKEILEQLPPPSPRRHVLLFSQVTVRVPAVISRISSIPERRAVTFRHRRARKTDYPERCQVILGDVVVLSVTSRSRPADCARFYFDQIAFTRRRFEMKSCSNDSAFQTRARRLLLRY